MAPVEIEVIPRDIIAAPVAHLKIVDKAFELPLVNDTYNEVTRLAAPMSPLVETVKEKMASAVDNLDLLACEGLDQLTAKVPALKEATPELMETAKDTTVSYAEYAK